MKTKSLLLLILGCLIPRVLLLTRFKDALVESDEAVMALMGLHMLKGEFPVFFWGQHYLGSIMAFPAVPFFALFGPHVLIVKLAPLLTFGGFLWVHYRLAREITSQHTAVLATFLLAISPAFLTIWSLKFRGSMILLFLGTAALLAATRTIKNGYSSNGFFITGILLGLAWWDHLLTALYATGIGLTLILKNERAFLRTLPWLAIGFFTGSAPFWIYNILHNWASFQLQSPVQTSYIRDQINIFWTGLPIILGARSNWGDTPFLPLLDWAVLLLFVCSVGLLAFRFFRHRPPAEWKGLQLILILVLATPPVLSVTGLAWFMREPRYLLPIYSALYILLLQPWNNRKIQNTVFAFLLGVNLLGTFQITHGEFTIHSNVEKMQPLIEFLEENQLNHVYASYWVAYRLAFESGERIIATPLPSDTMRYQPYYQAVNQSIRPGIVNIRGPVYDRLNFRVPVPDGYQTRTVGSFEVSFRSP